jgi:predicted RNA-binding protein with PUA-like domain
MAHWLLQGNPAHWRIHDFFTAGHSRTTWAVRRSHSLVTPGDDVALWVSGRPGGVVALGTVTGPAQFGPPPPDPYDLLHRDADRWSIPVSFHRHFLDQPVSRATLKADERFADSPILRAPGAGNPFPLTPAAWEAVMEHAPLGSDGSQLVARTVMVGAAVAAGAVTAVREAFRSVTTL